MHLGNGRIWLKIRVVVSQYHEPVLVQDIGF